eukprot:2742163-Rhodomonas_salina.1
MRNLTEDCHPTPRLFALRKQPAPVGNWLISLTTQVLPPHPLFCLILIPLVDASIGVSSILKIEVDSIEVDSIEVDSIE